MWEKVLQHLKEKDFELYGPESFQDYLAKNHIPKKNTAASISIDSYEKLARSLREKDCMVLRLGSSERGTGTQFVIVKAKNHLQDFFLMDEDVFTISEPELFVPTQNLNTLKGYRIMPVLSETSLVNLALTSGLLSHALEFDSKQVPGAPTTGKSTFSFRFQPHSKISKIVEHRNGQVEIDALFVEQRKGKDTLFIIEAKSDLQHRSLAKHKLLYPVLSVTENVSEEVVIVPIYMKIIKRKEAYLYHIVECEMPDLRRTTISIDEIRPKRHHYMELKLFA